MRALAGHIICIPTCNTSTTCTRIRKYYIFIYKHEQHTRDVQVYVITYTERYRVQRRARIRIILIVYYNKGRTRRRGTVSNKYFGERKVSGVNSLLHADLHRAGTNVCVCVPTSNIVYTYTYTLSKTVPVVV